MEFSGQVCKLNNERLFVRMFHIMNMEGLKVADDDPARTFGKFKFISVAFRLLIGCQNLSVRLFCRLVEINIFPFLFDHNFCFGNISVDKACVSELDLVFKVNVFFGFLYVEDCAEETEPECVGFSFFVSASAPFLNEFSSGVFLF